MRTRGSLDAGKYLSAFEQNGKVLAVVTLGDDSASLEAEAALEAGDEAKLAALVG